jgi:hypothetical protein
MIVDLLRLVPNILEKSIACALLRYHAVRGVNERAIQPWPRGPHNRWRLLDDWAPGCVTSFFGRDTCHLKKTNDDEGQKTSSASPNIVEA